MKKLAQAGPGKVMALYVAYLRALYLVHQNSHWQCKGPNFYAHHLMFERLYQSAQANADLAAEKTVGLFGNDTINLSVQSKMIQKFTSRYTSDDHIVNSLKAEKDFLSFSKYIYHILKENDTLTLGLDDMIMEIASKREEAVYLLQQSLA
jgi:DNA-binding ferritin-like protein